MRTWFPPLTTLLLASLLLIAPAPASAAPASEEPQATLDHAGVGIPDDEAIGFVSLPLGDVFAPLVADPKSTHSFLSYQREHSGVLGVDIGAVGIGDRFGLMRWGGPRAGEGFQISLSGGVLAQFDLASTSFDLINADYIIGLPMTFRRGGFSGRARFYHQSSHLGDEFLLREGLPIERENLSFESAELILSADLRALRLYAGGEYIAFVHDSLELERGVVHAGVELRQRGHLIEFGRAGSLHLLAALDVKLVEEHDWKPAFSARAGFDIGRAHANASPGRSWGMLVEYYSGPSPYGQFLRDEMEFVGFGIHFSP